VQYGDWKTGRLEWWNDAAWAGRKGARETSLPQFLDVKEEKEKGSGLFTCLAEVMLVSRGPVV
jgi:hypothetical protein